MNKVILMGRLTTDPELRTTQSGLSVAALRIAVNRRFAKQGGDAADFFDVVCWRQTAEFAAKYFKKGQRIAAVGALQTRKWTDKDGQNRYATEVIAEEVYFADGKRDEPRERMEAGGDFVYINEDEDGELPF